MPESEPITSAQNPLIKRIRALRKRRERERTGQTVVEGVPELMSAFEAAKDEQRGIRVEVMLVCPERVTGSEGEVLLAQARSSGVSVRVVAPHVFEKSAYREDSGGLLAVITQPRTELSQLVLGSTPLLLIADAIEKPGNLGAMLRSADAAGVDALIASAPVTDLFNPNVIRASVGSVFSLSVAAAEPETVHQWLTEKGIAVVSASPRAETRYTDADLKRPTAIVVGSEHHGVSPFWTERATEQVCIPMQGRVDSLNAGMAAAVLLFEAVRQRSL